MRNRLHSSTLSLSSVNFSLYLFPALLIKIQLTSLFVSLPYVSIHCQLTAAAR